MTELRHLRLVETSGRRRGLPRLRVKIAVSTDCVPYGQSRQFHIRERDLEELLATAEQIERRA